MACHHTRSLLASTAVALTLAAGPLAAAPQVPAPFSLDADAQAVTPSLTGTRLAHLPADRDELVLRGERARRSFSIDLARGEADQTTVFQIAFKNTVVLLPDRSSLEVTVNGHSLAVLQPRSSDTVSAVPVTIPRGVLNAGANQVEIVATMAHRVDCSVAATYELWTAIDPERTGFVLPAPSFGPIRGLRDVASEALAADGTTRISFLFPSTPDEAAITRASRFIGALVTRAGLTRPSVDVGSTLGEGPGMDVILGVGPEHAPALDGFREIGREDGVTIARSLSTGRLALILTADDADALDAKLSAFAGDGRDGHLDRVDGLAPDSRRTFADFGLRTDPFPGRHYTASLDVALPWNFLATDHDNARLLLDGVYAGNLDADSGLAVRVNGLVGSTLSLASDHGGTLQHRPVDLPMRLFHPGHNDVTIDGVLSAPIDRQCDASSIPATPRLVLSDTSELEIPRYTPLATSSQLPGALARFAASREQVPVYLSGDDEDSVGGALNLLANMAAQGYAAARPVVHIGAVAETAPPGILVAPWSALPPVLSGALRDEVVASAAPFSPSPDGSTGQSREERTAPAPIDALRRLPERLTAFLNREGFAYGVRSGSRPLPATSGSLLLASLDIGPRPWAALDLDLPRFAGADDQWLIATGADSARIRTGLERMSSGGRWRELEGQAVSLDTAGGPLSSMQPKRVSYMLPDKLGWADVRPILGGILSGNITLSLSVLVLLMSILGLSTHVMLRRPEDR